MNAFVKRLRFLKPKAVRLIASCSRTQTRVERRAYERCIRPAGIHAPMPEVGPLRLLLVLFAGCVNPSPLHLSLEFDFGFLKEHVAQLVDAECAGLVHRAGWARVPCSHLRKSKLSNDG